MDAGVKAAIDAAGGKPQLAKILEISREAVAQWKQVPRGRVLEIEEKLGVNRTVLRPDLHLVKAPANA